MCCKNTAVSRWHHDFSLLQLVYYGANERHSVLNGFHAAFEHAWGNNLLFHRPKGHAKFSVGMSFSVRLYCAPQVFSFTVGCRNLIFFKHFLVKRWNIWVFSSFSSFCPFCSLFPPSVRYAFCNVIFWWPSFFLQYFFHSLSFPFHVPFWLNFQLSFLPFSCVNPFIS